MKRTEIIAQDMVRVFNEGFHNNFGSYPKKGDKWDDECVKEIMASFRKYMRAKFKEGVEDMSARGNSRTAIQTAINVVEENIHKLGYEWGYVRMRHLLEVALDPGYTKESKILFAAKTIEAATRRLLELKAKEDAKIARI